MGVDVNESLAIGGGVGLSIMDGEVSCSEGTMGLSANNIGFYVGAEYGLGSSDSKVGAKVDLLLGDIEGLAITANFSF